MYRQLINQQYHAAWYSFIGGRVILTRVPGSAPGLWGTVRAVYAHGLIVDTAHYGLWISFIDLYCGHTVVQPFQVRSA